MNHQKRQPTETLDHYIQRLKDELEVLKEEKRELNRLCAEVRINDVSTAIGVITDSKIRVPKDILDMWLTKLKDMR